MPESVLLAAALWAYLLAALAALSTVAPVLLLPPSAHRRRGTAAAGPWPLGLLWLAVTLHLAALALRWQRLGHGPFTTLHEILSSNLWSLALVLSCAAAALREVRAALPLAMPVLLLLAGWLLLSPPEPGHLPPTYSTVLLYLHSLTGKVYLGLLLVAVTLALVPLAASTPALAAAWRAPPWCRSEALAHRFAAFAFVAETLMLVAGAVWAQDAWGRWWAWDPLETWAFASWLALALWLHARVTKRRSPQALGIGLALVFCLAFLTFFGVPFVSTSPHKGAV